MTRSWSTFGTVGQMCGLDVVTILNPYPLLKQETELLGQLSTAASQGFGREKNLETIRDHAINGQDVLYVAISSNVAVGFAAIKDFGYRTNRGVFLTGIAIDPGHQHLGLGRRMIGHIIESRKYDLMAYTTQSPCMYKVLRDLVPTVFPNVRGDPIAKSISLLGAELMEGHGKNFDPATFVCRNMYDEFLYCKFPWSGDESVDGFFRDRLRVENGETMDGFLLIGLKTQGLE